MKKLILILCLAATASIAAPPRFSEVWGYLYKGEEKYFPNPAPFTDIACFSASVDGDGRLTGGHPQRPALKGALASARYHLVVTIPWNATLAHIYLNKDLPFRDRIIAGMVERSKPFDGVQVDFEGIAKADGTAYLKFLAAVKKALPEDKLFSVAVMARWDDWIKRSGADAFDYPFINRVADRVVIMAYPEHTSSGEAGPIAALDWCEKIYAYALKTIDPEKLVMGLPLYGRSWQKQKLARSYKGSEVWKEIQDKQINPSNDWKTGGSYSFQETVDIAVHYETFQSLEAKLNLYSQRPIRGVAFWRIGQEPPGFWENGFK